jgi:hypothetical protein
MGNSIQDFETELHRYIFQKMLNGFVKIAVIVFTKLDVENFSWQFTGGSSLKNPTIAHRKCITN